MEGGLGDQALEIHEFEPFCTWKRREDSDILEIHLEDFKREQLKVQISRQGKLKISGERLMKPSQKSKFYKELAIADIYDSSRISAQFQNGWLHITMPKRKPVVPEKDDKRVVKSKGDQGDKQGSINYEAKALPSNDIEDEFQGRKWPASALKFAKTAVTVAVTGVAVAALVAYVIYMYKSTVGEVDDCSANNYIFDT